MSRRASAPTDPLERLCRDAIELCNVVGELISMAEARPGSALHLDEVISRFSEKLISISGHDGPEWELLNSLDVNPVEANNGSHSGRCYVSVADLMGRYVYNALLASETSHFLCTQLLVSDSTKAPRPGARRPVSFLRDRPLDSRGIYQNWTQAQANLSSLPECDLVRLAAQIETEWLRVCDVCASRRLTAAFAIAPDSVTSESKAPAFPPDSGWHFDPGEVWFRKKRFEVGGKIWEITKLFALSRPGQRLGYAALAGRLSEQSNETIKQHVYWARRFLRQVCAELEIDCPNPLPFSPNAGWSFAMPRE